MEIFIEYLESRTNKEGYMNSYQFIILDSMSYEIGNFKVVINKCDLDDSHMELFLDAYEVDSEDEILDETLNYLNNNLDILEEATQGSDIDLSLEVYLVDKYKKIIY